MKIVPANVRERKRERESERERIIKVGEIISEKDLQRDLLFEAHIGSCKKVSKITNWLHL